MARDVILLFFLNSLFCNLCFSVCEAIRGSPGKWSLKWSVCVFGRLCEIGLPGLNELDSETGVQRTFKGMFLV